MSRMVFFNVKEPSLQAIAGSRRESVLYNTKSEVPVSNVTETECGLHKDHIATLREYDRSKQ